MDLFEQFLLKQEWNSMTKEEQEELEQKRCEHYNETGELLEWWEL